MVKYLRISSYIRKPFLIYDFATDPILNFLSKILFSFPSVCTVSVYFLTFLDLRTWSAGLLGCEPAGGKEARGGRRGGQAGGRAAQGGQGGRGGGGGVGTIRSAAQGPLTALWRRRLYNRRKLFFKKITTASMSVMRVKAVKICFYVPSHPSFVILPFSKAE